MKPFLLGLTAPFAAAVLTAVTIVAWTAALAARDALTARLHRARPITMDLIRNGGSSDRETAHWVAATLLAGGRLRIVRLPGARVMLFVDDWRPADVTVDDAVPTMPDLMEEAAAKELARHGRGGDPSHCTCGEPAADLDRHIARHVLYAAMTQEGSRP